MYNVETKVFIGLFVLLFIVKALKSTSSCKVSYLYITFALIEK